MKPEALTPETGTRDRLLLIGFALILLVLVPALNQLVDAGSAFHVSDFAVNVMGKFICYGVVALGIEMIWGLTGILSLGQGVFFAMGGYLMGMHLMRNIGTQGVYASELPDFMVFLDWKELPWYWHGFDSFTFTLLVLLVLPTVFAGLFGWFAFRSGIKGVYFSIITQALTFALMLLFFRNDTGFGGNNGMTDFKTLLGMTLQSSDTRIILYMASGVLLLAVMLLCRWVRASRAGRLLKAIRDAEDRLRSSGYNPVSYKTFIFALAALISACAGALYVPQVGIINPTELAPAQSIEMVIWVAVGGRGSLWGALTGAIFVNSVKSLFTGWYPEAWLYVLGGLFVVTTLYLQSGIIGLLSRPLRRLKGESS